MSDIRLYSHLLSHCHQQSNALLCDAPISDEVSPICWAEIVHLPTQGTDTPSSSLHSYPHHCPWLAFHGQSHHASKNSIQIYTAVKCPFARPVASNAAVVAFHVTGQSRVVRADGQLHHPSEAFTGSDSSSSVGE